MSRNNSHACAVLNPKIANASSFTARSTLLNVPPSFPLSDSDANLLAYLLSDPRKTKARLHSLADSGRFDLL